MSNSSDPRTAPGDALAVTDAEDAALDAHGHDPADYDWVPVLRKPRADGWTPQKQRAFIGVLADTGSVREAAMSVGMTPSSAYKLRRSPGGEAFAAAWDAAIQQAAHALIDDAFERAFNGCDEPVYGRDGRVVGLRRRKSDAMAMFLLRKHFPERYGDLHRDRPERTAPPALPAVAATMIALGPVQPADPAALMAPEDAAIRFAMADALDGDLARFHRQDGSVQREAEARAQADADDPDFEARLEAAKREADPDGYAQADARRAEIAALDDEQEERRARRDRRRGVYRLD